MILRSERVTQAPMADTSEVPHHRTPAWAFLAGAIILGLGLAGAGFLTGRGFERGRSADRYVTVKGLAESFVTADLAVWPLRIIATGDDLARVQEQIDQDLATVTAFLTEEEIEPQAIQPQRVEVTDLLAQSYRPEGIGDNRFIVAQTIIVRTEQVERVARLNQQTGELVKRGVVLADTGGPSYLFTRLNEIKPDLLAAATRNARVSAEQFAADSGSSIAEIRRASQGLFEILPRDPAPGLMEANQVDKKIRVVSTIEYRLID
jgi:uncharacterized protein